MNMKKIAFLFCVCALVGFAEEATITKSTMLKADRSAVSLKIGTVVEVLAREENSLTVRYNKLTGTIPASCVAPASGEAAKKEVVKPTEPPPPRKAETTYGKAVEKARENAGKHEKNLVKPADEVIEK